MTWTTVGEFASTTAITTVSFSTLKGVVASYQAFGSNATSLAESKNKLKRVKSRLDELSPQQREQIDSENATLSESSDYTVLEGLQLQLDALSKRYEEASFTERHSPFAHFRNRVSKLEDRARALLNDTLKTTVPCLDDIDFDPEASCETPNLKLSGSESTDAFFTPPTSPNAEDFPMSRMV